MIRTQVQQASGSGFEFVQAIREAAHAGAKQLRRPVRDDYDQLEVHRGGGRFDAVLFLTGVRADVEVSFVLPMARLACGYDLLIDTQHGLGCWMYGVGISPHDPLDVMRAAFEDADEAALAEIVLPVLFDYHTFRTTRGWDDLKQRYGAHSFRYGASAAGLAVTFLAGIEASSR